MADPPSLSFSAPRTATHEPMRLVAWSNTGEAFDGSMETRELRDGVVGEATVCLCGENGHQRHLVATRAGKVQDEVPRLVRVEVAIHFILSPLIYLPCMAGAR